MSVPDTTLSRSAVARRLGVHRESLINLERGGAIPAAERVSGKLSTYRPEDVVLIAIRMGVAIDAR